MSTQVHVFNLISWNLRFLNKEVMILAFMFFMFLKGGNLDFQTSPFPECGHWDPRLPRCAPRPRRPYLGQEVWDLGQDLVGTQHVSRDEISVLTPNTCFALSWLSFETNVEIIYTHAKLVLGMHFISIFEHLFLSSWNAFNGSYYVLVGLGSLLVIPTPEELCEWYF